MPAIIAKLSEEFKRKSRISNWSQKQEITKLVIPEINANK